MIFRIHPLAATMMMMLPLAAAASGMQPPDTVLIQNPQGRHSLLLDGRWRVIPDPYDNGYYDYRFKPRKDGYFRARERAGPSDLVEYDFRHSQPLSVPGDWNSQDERYFFYEGTMWYFRTFDLTPDKSRRYLLYFGAANYQARAWLNGRLLGHHEGGFTPFQFDATDALKDGENILVVMVENRRAAERVPALNTDWWNYGGITRSVRLIDVPPDYVADYRFSLSDEGAITGWVRVTGAVDRGPVTVSIPELSIDETIAVDESGFARIELPAKPQRWSPKQPTLYDVRLSYADDSVADRIGFRTIAVHGDEILLNGEPVFLKGISIHEEALSRPGRAWSEKDARELLGKALELGCNFVRLAHYPHDENMLRVADELGLLIWAE
ncbi:MAG TPA: glycoside hydrolase family 2 TIM barrel-domain containing protein, partial [Woeseiaceae bacterium]|nr:glycoside hydrolase family 2 TIM barrel-domain containing protein [Woeseiaceae bacterium]